MSILLANTVRHPTTGELIKIGGDEFADLIRDGWFFADEKLGRLGEPSVKSLLGKYWDYTPNDLRRTFAIRSTSELMSLRQYILDKLPTQGVYYRPMTMAQSTRHTLMANAVGIVPFRNPKSVFRFTIIDSLVQYITSIYSGLSTQHLETLAREIELPSLKTRAILTVISSRMSVMDMLKSSALVDVLSEPWLHYFVVGDQWVFSRFQAVIDMGRWSGVIKP